MRPLLPARGALWPIRALPAGEIGPGDVVLYRAGGGRELVHRVWWKDRDGLGFWIKDDAGDVPLHRVPARDVLGVLDARRPLSRGWAGLVYGVVVCAVFVVVRFLKNVTKVTS